MKENIYDNDSFFDNYIAMRNDKENISANEVVEMPAIYEALPDLKGKRVLDLGCGYGNNCKKAIELGASYVLGLDISKNMINLANKTNKDNNIEYQVLAMEDIDQIKEKFDVVISSLAFHYVENYDKLLKDIYRLLNKDGELIFSQEHPLTTGTILTEATNFKSKVKFGDKEYKIISDYNTNGPRTATWFEASYTKYHRNMSTIINGLIDNNYKLIKVIEPIATEENVKKNLKYLNQLNVPYFMIIIAKKEGKND